MYVNAYFCGGYNASVQKNHWVFFNNRDNAMVFICMIAGKFLVNLITMVLTQGVSFPGKKPSYFMEYSGLLLRFLRFGGSDEL